MEFNYLEPVSSFSDGLVVLKSYHENFIKRGYLLLQLVADIKEHGMNEAYAHECVATFCHYDHATHLHHQDEEQCLFPVLLNSSPLVEGMIERLLMDHEEIETAWSTLAKLLKQPESITNVDALQQSAIIFEKLLREHLTREDEDFSPHVQAILTTQQRADAGKKMADLRHLSN